MIRATSTVPTAMPQPSTNSHATCGFGSPDSRASGTISSKDSPIMATAASTSPDAWTDAGHVRRAAARAQPIIVASAARTPSDTATHNGAGEWLARFRTQNASAPLPVCAPMSLHRPRLGRHLKSTHVVDSIGPHSGDASVEDGALRDPLAMGPLSGHPFHQCNCRREVSGSLLQTNHLDGDGDLRLGTR